MFCSEDKGSIGGFHWTKSPVTEFKTESNPSPSMTEMCVTEANKTFSYTDMVITISVVSAVLLILGVTLFGTIVWLLRKEHNQKIQCHSEMS